MVSTKKQAVKLIKLSFIFNSLLLQKSYSMLISRARVLKNQLSLADECQTKLSPKGGVIFGKFLSMQVVWV